MAQHELLNAIRKAGCRKRGGDPESALDLARYLAGRFSGRPSSRIRRLELRESLRRGLAELPEDQQKAVRLRFLEGWSVKDVAIAMGRSANAIGKLLGRAVGGLRGIIQR